MNLRRIVANAIARRVAYVLVALVLAWFGLGDARAQTYPNCTATYEGSATCADRESAYVSAKSAAEYRCGLTSNCHSVSDIPQMMPPTSGNLGGVYFSYKWGPSGAFNANGPTRYWVTECPAGYYWNEETKTCGVPCSDELPIPATAAHAPGDAQSFCQGGCAYACSGASLLLTIDGVLRTVCAGPWQTSAGATCSAGDQPPLTPVEDSDGDGVSDEYDLSPNNPGESGDGSGQDVSRACGGPGQPECLPDGSNEGSGRGNTSGGGGDCNTPPRSSGDAILAQIAFQTWATRCAVLGTANQGSGTGIGEGEGDQPNWTKGEGPEAPVDDTDYVTEQTRFGLPVSTDLLDQENIFGAASCEHFSIPIWRGISVSTTDFDGWCTLQAILRGLILIFGAFTAIQILLGKW